MNRLRDMDGDEPAVPARGGGAAGDASDPGNPGRQAAGVAFDPARARDDAGARGFRTLVLKLALVAIVAFGAGTAGAVITRRWQRDRSRRATASASATPRSTPPPAAPRKGEPDPGGRPRRRRGHRHGGDEPAPETPGTQRAEEARQPAAERGVGRARADRGARRARRACGANTTRSAPARCWHAICRLIRTGRCARRRWFWPSRRRTREATRPAPQQLAQTYQAEFPAGRFLTFARSHTGGRTSH